jgi:hypothetical protein
MSRHYLHLIPTWLNSILYFLEFLYVCADADASCADNEPTIKQQLHHGGYWWDMWAKMQRKLT